MIFGTTHCASLQILWLNVQKKNPYFPYICLGSFNETLRLVTISKLLYITSRRPVLWTLLGGLRANLNLFAWQLSIGHLGPKLIWEVNLNTVYGGTLCNWEIFTRGLTGAWWKELRPLIPTDMYGCTDTHVNFRRLWNCKWPPLSETLGIPS